LRIAFIGDIVGRPGRKLIREHLNSLKDKYKIDLVIANCENASHGFGMTIKNCEELQKAGIDLFTGGNHSFDKKNDFIALHENYPVLRPVNYPEDISGDGIKELNIGDEQLTVINLMGAMSMPMTTNPFTLIRDKIEQVKTDNDKKNIIIDFHAEATSEKRVLFKILEKKVSAIFGTHTHIGTDDYEINEGMFYVTDVGLTGCCDNVIGMDETIPIKKVLSGLGGHYEVPGSCRSIFQLFVLDITKGKCTNGFKVKILSDSKNIKTYNIPVVR
jgi:metallophosphoesterase (TIGR00282 family)